MPNRDGSGPYGDGRPGRGLGPCGRISNASRGNRRGLFGSRQNIQLTSTGEKSTSLRSLAYEVLMRLLNNGGKNAQS